MEGFVDIHCHALFGVDDGAPDRSVMEKMLQLAYESGTRSLCFTPHFNYGEATRSQGVAEAFEVAKGYCEQNFPDMRLYLGNELSYRYGCVEALTEEACKTMAESRYVLVDFFLVPDVVSIVRAIETLQNAGYLPIVAHVERYDCCSGNWKNVLRVAETGAVLQVNASSLLAGPFSAAGRTAKKMISHGLAHIVASDAHDTALRPPVLSKVYHAILAKWGVSCADALLKVNPERVLAGKRILRP